MKVHLRQRQHSKQGSISLYLEIYKGTTTTAEGKIKPVRDYEYLNLYLVKNPRTPIDKQQNKDTLKLAENIKAKRELEIQNGEYGFSNNFKNKTNFIEYFREQTEKRLQSKGTYGHWDSVLKQLINFAGTQVTFKDIDKNFCEQFKEYLTQKAITKISKKLSSNSVASYYIKFRACLNKAVEDEIILKSPAKNIETPKRIESKREFLTFDELKAITKAECKNEDLKKGFIFSCLTGLRWSDIEKLKWSEVQQYTFKEKGIEKTGWKITFHQQKTKGLQYQNISEQAREYLGEQGKPDEKVFKHLTYSSYMNVVLMQWMLNAGITKQITFHSSRHTNALLLLENGVDIYTVSKLLGHTQISTTQIYTKIFDEKKREAVNKIPLINI